MHLSLAQVYEFGGYRLDIRERLLLRDHTPISLTPKAFDILRILVQGRGHLITKEELLQQVWPDTTVEESNLTRNIFTLRRVLGDDQEAAQYIETVPKLGYRFISPVRLAAEGVSPRPARAIAAFSRARPTLVYLLALGGVIALLAGYGGWRYLHRRPPIPAGRIMLVVLPFQNLTGDPSQDFFSDGFTEEMITELSRMQPERLAVIARTSAMRYRNPGKAVDEIGKELGVQYVLEGSVRRAGQRVRISAQLIQVRDQTHLWAESYERDLSDVLALQQEVSHAIGREIEVKLSPEQGSRRAPPRAVDPQAYEDYLQGRYFWNKRTREGFERAIQYFEQAIARDGGAPQFYAGLADAYALMGSLPDTAIPRAQAMEKARAAAQKALAMDDSMAEAHTSLAFVEMHYDWNWPVAEKEFLRALELNPGYATAHHWYAYYLIAMDRKEESLREIRRAQELDPLSLIITRDVGDMLYLSRRYDEAIEQCRQTLERDPDFFLAHMLLGAAYLQTQRYPEMLKELQLATGGSHGQPWAVGALGAGEAAWHHDREAARIVAELQRLDGQGEDETHSIAVVYSAWGKADQAFVWLDRAYARRNGSMILLKVDPVFDPLRKDPRFSDLLRRMNLN
ncbi:MAG: winged helix-turn-helix domain-containing protein [Acidobacteriia bacterium]|nr:winged helix-turn-helix domain-containing protein [Terriglobia bacterium]